MFIFNKRKIAGVLTAAFMSAVVTQAVAADDYPNKPIQVVLPIAPGGDTDVNARVFAKHLQDKIGQKIVIVNVDGAGGTIGMRRVQQAKPDGYTAMFFHGEALIPKLAGITDIGLDDFKMAAIAIVDNTTILVTHKDTPYGTLEELDNYLDENPESVTFGMLTGGFPHLVGVALNDLLKEDTTMVDIGGNAAKIVALRGKKVDVINTQYQLVEDYLESGDFINLGLLSEERNDLIPDVKTTTEQGYPMAISKFFFFAMPEDTPDDIVDIFSTAVKEVINDDDYREEASKYYLTPTYKNPEEATKFVQKELEALQQYKTLFAQE